MPIFVTHIYIRDPRMFARYALPTADADGAGFEAFAMPLIGISSILIYGDFG